MNLSMKRKQNHKHREQIRDSQGVGRWSEGWDGRLGLADTAVIQRMGRQQGPTV